MEVNKKELKEQEIRTLFITPALQQKGWAVSVNMREEYYFTDGRVLVVGNQHSVAEGKKADYLLYHKGKPIAVVEAKDNKHAVDEPYPVIVTTSELLSTGVDCKTCGLIVIDKEIGSMTEFKQIIGRGTRLRKDKGKWHLEILDFRNATAKFKDPSFDGDPEPPKGSGKKPKPYPPVPSNPPTAHEPREKYLINGKDIRIAHEIVSVLGEDGKTMRTESVQSFARKQLLRHYQSLDDFVQTWTEAERKQAVMDELKEYAILIDAVREANPALKDADIFDVICHVAFDQPPLTRKERANNVKKRNYFGKYEGKAREVLEALLDKYAENGILDFEKANILEIPPFNSIGKPTKIIKLFGGKVAFEQAIRELEYQIYKSA